MKYDYDLVVIGGGNAGCKAALIAAEKGMKVAIIEQGKWGGSDLNFSNVPFNAMFTAAHLLKDAQDGSRYGLSSTNLRYNFPGIRNWVNLAMKRAGAGSKKELEDAGVTCIKGRGHLLSSHEVSDGKNTLKAKKILLATGAGLLDTGIKIPKGVSYLAPSEVLNLVRLPKTVFIVGAGATGCELAQLFSALGSNVIIADYAGRLLPREDEEVGQVLDYVLNANKIKVLTQSRVIGIIKDGAQKRVIFLRGGLEKAVKVDEVIVCTGSAANTDIGLENAGVDFDKSGVKVNEYMQTNVKHIYAAGDITGGHSSADRAILQAEYAARNISGHKRERIYEDSLVRTIKCIPEIAVVGKTEDDCLRRDLHFKKVTLPLGEVAKSNISDFADGFIKLLCEKNGKIIGATVMAPHAALIIQEISLAMHAGLDVKALAEAPHQHYEWSELVREAAKQMF